jgi:uncharacterized protein
VNDPGSNGAPDVPTPQPVELVSRRRRPEWPSTLDVARLRSSGWEPAGFRQYLFKIASRCNLDCDYCYVYHQADSTWRDQPRFMSDAVVDASLERMREHVVAHELERVSIVFHGGEPLLAGAEYLQRFARKARSVLGDQVSVRLTMQSNGTLLTPAILDVMLAEGIAMGISLDGDRAANDLHRLDRHGRSSFDAVARGLELLSDERYSSRMLGLLCTINLEAEPMAVYEGLLSFSPPWLDLLLPHGTWDEPPPGKEGDPMGSTPYADWLIPIFDSWFAERVKPVSIRIFEEVVSLVMGGRSRFESFGVETVSLIVIEADGSIEQVDSLKAAYDGAADTGMTVFANSFDEVLLAPAVVARQIGMDALDDTCRACDLVSICGAGLYSHRHRTGTGFLNPSVYCADLDRLIRHVAAAVDREVAIRRNGPNTLAT